MIDLTVKTLDSQNHAFSVEDDITVQQFKEHIAGVVNIPAESQRLIYCGRVLQDTKKLNEYDVNGKVIHLVQRAPPSATRRNRSPSSTTTTNSGGRRGIFQGPVYLGSMALPSGIMEAQGIVQPPPTQSLAGSRLNVARRMLKKADTVLKMLEDPEGSQANNRESPSEETTEDVTPVFAAQVFVPNPGSDDALAAAVSAMENGILQDQVSSVPSNTDANSSANSSTASNTAQQNQEAQPSSSSTDTSRNSQSGQQNQLPENASSTNEMAKLLDELNKIQDRLRPFQERYHRFMAEDPTLEGDQNSENVQQTQTVINRVSEIMHLLGHAYHSLSDVMVQVRQAPPRPLLCRPILIQHSAVLQAGIPIQVEAQINLTPDRRPPEFNNASAPNVNPTETSTTNTQTPTTETRPGNQGGQQRSNVHEIRIDSFPIDFRNLTRQPAYMNMMQHVQNMARNSQPPTNNQNAENVGANANANNANNTTNPPTNNAEAGQQQQVPQQPAAGAFNPAVLLNNGMNPNMEFFMEVTPESITIDSLETTVVTSAAQADNVLRGTFGGAPPEFLQTILQAVAGQMMGGNLQPQNLSNTTVSSAESAAASTISGTQTSNTGPNINSQARSNTQTHPTTSTQTRSTPRPHVHLAQHTMQGFDPFLPCNSHHIRRRRVGQPTQTAGINVNVQAEANAETAQNNNQNNNQNNPLYNILQGFLRTVGNHMGRMTRERPATQENASNAQTNAAPPTQPRAPQPNNAEGLTSLSGFLSTNMGSTISSLLQTFSDSTYTEGESLFTDLMLVLTRELTLGDLIALNGGQLYPLARVRPALRTYFQNRVLQGESPTQPAIDRGATRLITEITPLVELIGEMPVREDIDIVQSVLQLFRARFPSIIYLALSRNSRSLNFLVEQCMLTVRTLCALLLHCSSNGMQGVEDVIRSVIVTYTQGINPDILDWTIASTTTQLRIFLSTIEINPSALAPYIVRRSANRQAQEQPQPSAPAPCEAEAMEVDEPIPIVESVQAEPAQVVQNQTQQNQVPQMNTQDLETLPNVVIGSEQWHQVTPNDWIPIITRDIQKQKKQSPQPSFSDAYLSGMPSKRRKIIQHNKPQGNVSQIISDAVRRAVTSSGLSSAVPLDTVVQAASNDTNLQSAYRELLRTRIQANLQNNPEFNPERFPNASTFFNVNKRN